MDKLTLGLREVNIKTYVDGADKGKVLSYATKPKHKANSISRDEKKGRHESHDLPEIETPTRGNKICDEKNCFVVRESVDDSNLLQLHKRRNISDVAMKSDRKTITYTTDLADKQNRLFDISKQQIKWDYVSSGTTSHCVSCLYERQWDEIRKHCDDVLNAKEQQLDDIILERNELRLRNIDLERQLSGAKKVIRSQEKRLLLYSQLIDMPPMNFAHDLKPLYRTGHPSSRSSPGSPSKSSFSLSGHIKGELMTRHSTDSHSRESLMSSSSRDIVLRYSDGTVVARGSKVSY